MAKRSKIASVVRRTDLGNVLDFLRLFWKLDHTLQMRSKRMERTHGITGVQRLVIRIVAEIPHLSAAELADLLHLDPSTLTGVVKRLEGKLLLERQRDPTDGRRMMLTLTRGGRDLNRRRHGTIEEVVARVLRRLPPAQIAGARAVLEALVAE